MLGAREVQLEEPLLFMEQAEAAEALEEQELLAQEQLAGQEELEHKTILMETITFTLVVAAEELTLVQVLAVLA